MFLQNSYIIIGSILHICYPASQKLCILNWHVGMLQWSKFGVPIISFGSICYEKFHIPHWCCWIPGVSNNHLILKTRSYHNYQFNLSRVPSIFFKPIHIHAWFNCFSFTWSLHYKGHFLVRFSFSFGVAFSQPFLTSADYMTTFEKFLGYSMDWDSSDPDYFNAWNEFFNYFTITLNNFCNMFPLLFDERSAPLCLFCDLLIWLRIFNLACLVLIFRCTYHPSQISLRASVLIYPSSHLSSAYYSSIEAKINSSFAKFHSFLDKLPPSNCSKVIMFPVFTWENVTYGMYETDGCIKSDSEYRHEVYANALENVLSNKTSCEETIFCVIGT